MLVFRFLGAPRPDVSPAPFRGVNPAGCPSCQTETEGRNPGNPEPVHPSRIILSTGLAYRLQGKEPAPGHGFRFPRCRGNLFASPGFLPAPVTPCFRFPGNGCRGTCIRGRVLFRASCQCSPGCPLRCGLSGNPAPVSPGGGFRFPPGEWNRGRGTGEPRPPRRMEPGDGVPGDAPRQK